MHNELSNSRKSSFTKHYSVQKHHPRIKKEKDPEPERGRKQNQKFLEKADSRNPIYFPVGWVKATNHIGKLQLRIKSRVDNVFKSGWQTGTYVGSETAANN